MDGMSLVYGDKKPVGDYPTTPDAASCEALCKANHTCTYGTWHDSHQGSAPGLSSNVDSLTECIFGRLLI